MKIIITGILGQDGSNMVEYLLNKTNAKIFGMIRRSSNPNFINCKSFLNDSRFQLVYGDLSDSVSIDNLVRDIQPDYFINFGAQSFVGCSWDIPLQTFDVNATGVARCLEAVRRFQPKCHFYSAGCHSSDTRVLTPSGLKNYKEIKVGDKVYSINPKSKDLELKKVTKLFEYDYDGELYEFKQGGLLVTPNHRMFYKTKRNNILVKNADEFIKLSDVKYPINNPYKGKSLPKFIDLSRFIPTQKRRGNKNYGKHITEINSHDLMYLIGLYIGDGSCRTISKKAKVACLSEDRNRDKDGRYTTESSQEYIDAEYKCPQTIIDIPKNDECFPKVINTLNKNNIKWSLHGQCDITFHQWGLIPYFAECGHSASQKCIPSWIFDLDSSYQLKVLEGIRDSDGDGRNSISTVSAQLQVDLLKLHINCGIMPTFGDRPPRTSVLKDGRIIKGNFPERWVYALKENTGYQCGNYKKVNYTGKVWCFEVEDNHNFIVERKGKLTFSGNSSEEFGDVIYSPQDINHPIRPRSPYGASKTAARHLVKVYRDSYNLYAVHGILFNHEGTKRGEEFVTRKISKGVARIYHAIKNNKSFDPIELGNLDAKRDWSDSEDFVDGVWKMLNQNEPKDYVLSSNETHSIREFVQKAFEAANIQGVWHGNGANEEFSITNLMAEMSDIKSSTLVKINPKYYRPAEVDLLLGDSTPAREELGWKPKISFDSLVSRMVKFDIENYKIGV